MFLRGDKGARAYGYDVGIGIWAVIALVTVLSVYLLPYLVGRREMVRRSNVQDRYSAELRVLATGAAAVEHDDTCASSGHAELFRRRPEVKVMNRPAVRNVRALRTERELDHARQVHAQGRERRRIAELEHTLVSLTGRRSSASVVAAPRSSVDSAGSAASVSAASPAAPAVSAGAVRDPFMERLAQEGAQQAAARSATSAPETTAEATTGAAVESPAEVEVSHAADSEAQRMAELDADLDAETAAAVAAEREATRRASVYVPSRHAGKVSRDMGVREAVSRDGGEESSPGTKDFVASLSTSTARRLTGWGELFAEASAIEQEAQKAAASASEAPARVQQAAPASSPAVSEPARPAMRPQAPAAAAPSETEGVAKEETTTSTPPQGWRPVHVPAPTYTLAARAPRRSYADPEVDPGTSAPVPARPQTARAYVPAPVEDDEEELFHPIDLDAILEGRRAAGE